MDLLEEARLRYPVGTVYYCNYLKREFKIEKTTLLKYYSDNKHKIDAKGMGFVYYHGEWSRIIRPKIKIYIGLNVINRRKNRIIK